MTLYSQSWARNPPNGSSEPGQHSSPLLFCAHPDLKVLFSKKHLSDKKKQSITLRHFIQCSQVSSLRELLGPRMNVALPRGSRCPGPAFSYLALRVDKDRKAPLTLLGAAAVTSPMASQRAPLKSRGLLSWLRGFKQQPHLWRLPGWV